MIPMQVLLSAEIRDSYDSACGRIGICWEKQEEAFNLRLSIPANVTAEVILPDGSARMLGSGTHELSAEWNHAD